MDMNGWLDRQTGTFFRRMGRLTGR